MPNSRIKKAASAISPQMIATLSRHLVTISWADIEFDKNNSQTHKSRGFCVTAFVVAVRARWFLVTAGHVLRDIDEIKNQNRKIAAARLVDGLGTNSQLPPIPFPLEDTPRWYLYSEKDGLDYGIMPLRPLYAQQLFAGGVRALTEEAWMDVPKNCQFHFLLGIPKQASTISIDQRGDTEHVQLAIGSPLLPVFPTKRPPRVLKRTNARFYAKVPIVNGMTDDGVTKLTDIDGMSGGPVFAVEKTKRGKNETYRYWVIAIQSGWESKTRVLAACPITPLIDFVSKALGKKNRKTKTPPS